MGDEPREENEPEAGLDGQSQPPDGQRSSREKPLARLGRSILPPAVSAGAIDALTPVSQSSPPHSGKLPSTARDAIGARPKGPPPLPPDAIAKSMRLSEPPSPFTKPRTSSPPPPRSSPLPPRPSPLPPRPSSANSPSRPPSVPPFKTTLSGGPAPRSIEDRVATLGTRLADLEPRLDVWQSRLDRFEALVNEGRAEVATARVFLDEIRIAVRGFDSRLASVEGFEGRLAAVEGFDARLAQAEGKAVAVETKLGSLRAVLDALEHRMAMLELPPSPDVVVDVKRVTRLEARIAMLEASSRSLTDRVDDFGGGAKKKGADDEVAALRDAIDDLRKRVEASPAGGAPKAAKKAAAAKAKPAADPDAPKAPKRPAKKRR